MVLMAGQDESWGWGGETISKVFKTKRRPNFKVTAENILYARKTDSTATEQSEFMILTKIGVSDYGSDSLKKIHIGMEFESKNTDYPKIEIVRILPTDSLKEVGMVTVKENKIVNMGGGVNAQIKSATDLKFLNWDIGGELKFKKQNDSEVLATYSYPKQLLITRSSGVGNDAIWEFKQGEVFGWKGQYDFNIVFRIPKLAEQIRTDNPAYYVIFDILINGKKIKFEPNGPLENASPVHLIF
jgi:hypothetical protein